jgi:hypothetical protein
VSPDGSTLFVCHSLTGEDQDPTISQYKLGMIEGSESEDLENIWTGEGNRFQFEAWNNHLPQFINFCSNDTNTQDDFVFDLKKNKEVIIPRRIQITGEDGVSLFLCQKQSPSHAITHSHILVFLLLLVMLFLIQEKVQGSCWKEKEEGTGIWEEGEETKTFSKQQ